jgi:hypothetical protein
MYTHFYIHVYMYEVYNPHFSNRLLYSICVDRTVLESVCRVAHARADREAIKDRDRNSSPKNDAPQLAPPYTHNTERAQCMR